MGLHGGILHGIIRRFFTGGALVENKTGHIPLTENMKTHGQVLISDLLTQLREVTLGAATGFDRAVRGDQLVDLFAKYVNKAVESGNFRAYVGVVDVQHLTPREKLAEQRARSTNRPIQPYPPGSRFVEEGISIPSPSGRYHTELINTQRVFADRIFRVQLFKFIADEIERRPWLIMKGVDFVMDFDEHHYFVLCNGVSAWKPHCYATTQGGVTTTQPRTIGEADIQMMVWAHQYSARHVVWIQSIDRDLIAIITAYIYQVQRMNRKGLLNHPLKGFWYSMGFQWEKNKSHPNAPKNYIFRALDMMQFTADIKRRFGWNPLHFVLACIMCGTDFLRKSDLVNLISVPMIFWGVCVAGREFTKRVGTARHRKDGDLSGAYFVLLLQTIYSEHYSNTKAYKGLRADDRALQYIRDKNNKVWAQDVQENPSEYQPLEPNQLWGISDKAYAKSQKGKAKREANKATKIASARAAAADKLLATLQPSRRASHQHRETGARRGTQRFSTVTTTMQPPQVISSAALSTAQGILNASRGFEASSFSSSSDIAKAVKAAALAKNASDLSKAFIAEPPPPSTQTKMTKFLPNNKSDNMSRRMRFPELKGIETTFLRVAWNMRYWIPDVCAMAPRPVYE